ncbi:hypothetical protein MCOR25_006769 [Pyricularia grisea]|uniref:Uncharacterized protein n=1 Tax=Pyricularia grisea TaxID=148305 RepID=A0A6P8B7H2_PYRGI|nr:hypothetical protein PgNI_06057 [Pyricularia grisea]KAI6360269.1 hypothetical protein MCOR25_006769 [Pyricularia grisea]TLD11079.1 hypothetical protein PgNI_06057 [Pyricularia grisea]
MFGGLIEVRPLPLAGFLVGVYVVAWFIQAALVDYRIAKRGGGGVRAPRIASNIFTAGVWFCWAGWRQMKNDLLSLYNSIYDRHGSPDSPNCVEITLTTPSVRFILTREPEHVKTILTSKFSDFGKGYHFHKIWSPFLGDSIFTTDGQLWHDSRSLIRPMFIKEKVRDLDIFDRWTNEMLSMLPPPGQSVDLANLFYRLTLDVTTDFLLGESVKSLRDAHSEFANYFNEVQRIQMMLTILVPAAPFLPRHRYNAGIKYIEKFMEPYIEQALALPPDELEKLSKTDKDFTFLHNIARYSRDRKVIRDQIMAVLLAGRDTTAATLSWTIYHLCKTPEVVKRLRQEILRVVGPFGNKPTYENLKELTYLTHIINETLRMYPAVPYNIRAALEDSSLPSPDGKPPIAVLKGDIVVYSALSMQRRRDIYPEVSETFADPAVFSPDRWDHWTPKPWTYVPFNGGPRICVGQNFAMTEMAYILVLLFQKYERIEYCGDWDAQYHKAEIVGAPGQGVPVTFYPANDEVKE